MIVQNSLTLSIFPDLRHKSSRGINPEVDISCVRRRDPKTSLLCPTTNQ